MSRLRAARVRAGLTQSQLAERSGLAQSLVSRAESGSSIAPDSLAKLADALGVGVDEIADDAPSTPATRGGDGYVIPALSQRPGWDEVLSRARAEDPTITGEEWDEIGRAPGLFAVDVPVTAAMLLDLARLYRRHRPPKR